MKYCLDKWYKHIGLVVEFSFILSSLSTLTLSSFIISLTSTNSILQSSWRYRVNRQEPVPPSKLQVATLITPLVLFMYFLLLWKLMGPRHSYFIPRSYRLSNDCQTSYPGLIHPQSKSLNSIGLIQKVTAKMFVYIISKDIRKVQSRIFFRQLSQYTQPQTIMKPSLKHCQGCCQRPITDVIIARLS